MFQYKFEVYFLQGARKIKAKGLFILNQTIEQNIKNSKTNHYININTNENNMKKIRKDHVNQ